jgi:hypothetical protein
VPTEAIDFVFKADQRVEGFAYSEYMNNTKLYDGIFVEATKTILGSSVSVTIDSVLPIVFENEHKKHTEAVQNVMLIDYSIYVPSVLALGYASAPEAFDALSESFRESTASGRVNAEIKEKAETKNATELYNATSDTVFFNTPNYPTAEPTQSGSGTFSGSTSPIHGLTLTQFIFILMFVFWCVGGIGYLISIKIHDCRDRHTLFADSWPAVQQSAEQPLGLSSQFEYMRNSLTGRFSGGNPQRGSESSNYSSNANPIVNGHPDNKSAELTNLKN